MLYGPPRGVTDPRFRNARRSSYSLNVRFTSRKRFSVRDQGSKGATGLVNPILRNHLKERMLGLASQQLPIG